MKWSWKLTRVAGIDVYVHATFFILIAWIAMSYWRLEGNIDAVMAGVFFILAVFLCIVLHELGHALTARRYGIKTKNITLLPIGGVALLERMPEDPIQEVKVALAGPAVNLVIVALLWFWISLTSNVQDPYEISLSTGSFAERLLIVNFILAFFNLLPAFPMDGGRVFRAVLSMRMDRNRATQIAVAGGQILALWFGYMGLMYNPFLIFIALFVWIGAAAEAGMEQIKFSLADIPVGKAMLTDFQTLQADDPLARAIELTLSGSQKDFPVIQKGNVVGILSQMNLLKGLQLKGDTSQISEWMEENVESAQPDEQVVNLLQRMQSQQTRLITIVDQGRLVGIVNFDNIMELISIQKAMHK